VFPEGRKAAGIVFLQAKLSMLQYPLIADAIGNRMPLRKAVIFRTPFSIVHYVVGEEIIVVRTPDNRAHDLQNNRISALSFQYAFQPTKKRPKPLFQINKTKPVSMAVVLDTGCPQASKAVIINRGLPGQKFFHCQRVTRTGLFKAEKSAPHCRYDFCLTADDPTAGVGWRKISYC
jgi:hypothetical protein